MYHKIHLRRQLTNTRVTGFSGNNLHGGLKNVGRKFSLFLVNYFTNWFLYLLYGYTDVWK